MVLGFWFKLNVIDDTSTLIQVAYKPIPEPMLNKFYVAKGHSTKSNQPLVT